MLKTAFLAIVILLAGTLIGTNRTVAGGSPIAFQVSNQQSQALGLVTVSTLQGDFFVSVPDENTYPVQIPETATSVTINGQIVPQGVKAIVTLQGGKQVVVLWPSPNNVIVMDDREIG